MGSGAARWIPWLLAVAVLGFGCGGGSEKQEAPASAEQGEAGSELGAGAESDAPARPPEGEAPALESRLGELDGAVTFVGVVPCADCPGIQVTLTLRPDGLYFLRDTYLEAEDGKDLSVVYRGTWEEEEGVGLVVHGTGDVPRRYAILDSETLRMLDAGGQEIQSSLPYELRRIPRPDPFEDVFRVEGMYRYMADAGRLTDCLTGRSWPVAMESANAELERAYLEARPAPGEPVRVDVLARFAQLPAMDGLGTEEMLVVDDVMEVDPDGSCGEER